jgi:uncharacterized protein
VSAATRPTTARNETRGTVLADRLEVVGSFWGRFMGLMGRATLPAGTGLWLPGDNGIHMFFMRFAIDAVFVGRPTPGVAGGGFRPVLSVHRSLRPWTGMVPLIRGADGVLELPTGTIDASGTQPGDVIFIG